MVENAPFCVVSVDAVIFKATDIKQELSVLPLVLPIQICLSASIVNVCLTEGGLSRMSLLVYSVVTNKHCSLIVQFIRMFLQDGHVPAPAT